MKEIIISSEKGTLNAVYQVDIVNESQENFTIMTVKGVDSNEKQEGREEERRKTDFEGTRDTVHSLFFIPQYTICTNYSICFSTPLFHTQPLLFFYFPSLPFLPFLFFSSYFHFFHTCFIY